jgi:hypothetical protein
VRYKGHIRHLARQWVPRARFLRRQERLLTGAEFYKTHLEPCCGSVGVVELQVFRGKFALGGR